MHHQESNANMYLQKSKAGRGLMEVESVYKLTKIKVERNHAKKLPSITRDVVKKFISRVIINYRRVAG